MDGVLTVVVVSIVISPVETSAVVGFVVLATTAFHSV